MALFGACYNHSMSNCCKDTKKCCGVSKVVIPAALGDENGQYKPENGAYFNTLVEYQASGVSYMYTNDGIPTRMGDGIVATIEVGETTTLQPGEDATVENVGDKYHAVLNFGIPEGQKGDTGDAATVNVGTTTTGAPGSDATVTNSGDEHNAILNFTIPRGDQGEQGIPGQAATIAVGTVTTLDPDQPATVTNSGTSSAAVFDFGIPKGDKGDTGAVSSEVVEELPIPGDDSKFYLVEKNPERNTESGEYINFETTQTAAAIQSAQIDGNATQQTYSGKNLFDLDTAVTSFENPDGVVQTGGATYSNGVVTMTWTLGASGRRLMAGFKPTLVEDTTYTLSADVYLSGTNATNNIAFGSISSWSQVTIAGKDAWYRISKTFTAASADVADSRMLIEPANTGNTLQYKNVQLEVGSTATDFQIYVGGIPAPNPGFPQLISVVTGENVVKVVGKNLWNGEFGQGQTFNPSTTNRITTTQSPALLSGQAYTVSAFNLPSGFRYAVALFANPAYPGSSPGAAVFDSGWKTSESFTFTPPSDCYFAVVMSKTDNTSLTPSDVSSASYQLELGSSSTTYEAFSEQDYEVNLGKNLFHMTETRSVSNSGVTLSTVEGESSFTLDGTSTATGNFSMNIIRGTAPLVLGAGTYAVKVVGLNAETTTTDYAYVGKNGVGAIAQLNPNNNWQNTFTLTERSEIYLQGVFASTTSYDNKEITVQIELGSTATSYAPYFTPIELAGVGEIQPDGLPEYHDQVKKNLTTGKWYIEKQVGKVVLDGTEDGWGKSGVANTNNYYCTGVTDAANVPVNNKGAISPTLQSSTISQMFATTSEYGVALYNNAPSQIRLCFPIDELSTLAQVTTWLSTHPTTVYYALATPTTTEITNQTLIDQLEALASAPLNQGANNIFIEIATGNAMPTLELSWAEWERYNRYNVYIWNDGIDDYQILNS